MNYARKQYGLLFLIILSINYSGFSQNQPITSDNKHEIGFDITLLLDNTIFKTRLNYPNLYQLMYRYHFNKWDIRSGIGVNYGAGKSLTNDTSSIDSENKFFAFRAGVEGKLDFYKRWQFFYGIDLLTRTTIYSSTDKFSSINKTEYFDKYQRYGVAPLLGLRFKLNKRISFTTESNFAIYYFNNEQKIIYHKNPQFNRITNSTGFNTLFTPVANVNFTYNF